ncbi:MAG: hypothetical protein M1113_05600 [Candidatus Thermoplasmatota archaeon]|nr:hypothetical protein [Candidatus Thermoplasmatota archaeon]
MLPEGSGFSVHLKDPVKLAMIFNSVEKYDLVEYNKVPKLVRLGELPEVNIPIRQQMI